MKKSNTENKPKVEELPLVETQIPGFMYNPNRSLTYSSGKEFLKSPRHWVQYLMKPFAPSEAMVLGNMVDCLILSKDDFEKTYLVADKPDLRNPQNKIDWTKLIESATNNKQTLVSKIQYEQAKKMSESVLTNRDALQVLNQVGETHFKRYWNDKETGLLCSCEMDGIGDTLSVEIKTAQDASDDHFSRNAVYLEYPLQVGFVTEMKRVKHQFTPHYFIIIESSEPYCVNVLKADDSFVEYGQWQFRKLMMEFKHCVDNNLFHEGFEFHHATGYGQLSLPGWVKYKIE